MTDWNAMSDADFRREVRQFFETEYPEELRHLPHRPKFVEIKHWHRRLHARGWVAPAWPTEHGGMGLKLLDAALIAETLGRHVTPVPFIASAIMARPISPPTAAPVME